MNKRTIYALYGFLGGVLITLILATDTLGRCVLVPDFLEKYQTLLAAIISVMIAVLTAAAGYSLYVRQREDKFTYLVRGLREELIQLSMRTAAFAIDPDLYFRYLTFFRDGKLSVSPFQFHLLNANLKELGQLPHNCLSRIMGTCYGLDQTFVLQAADSHTLVDFHERNAQVHRWKDDEATTAASDVARIMRSHTLALEKSVNELGKLAGISDTFDISDTTKGQFKR